jgi:hypothetical protein
MNCLKNLLWGAPSDTKGQSSNSDTAVKTSVISRLSSSLTLPKSSTPARNVLSLKQCFEPARDFDETLPEDLKQLQLKQGVTIDQLVAAAKAQGCLLGFEALISFFEDFKTIFLSTFFGFSRSYISEFERFLKATIGTDTLRECGCIGDLAPYLPITTYC